MCGKGLNRTETSASKLFSLFFHIHSNILSCRVSTGNVGEVLPSATDVAKKSDNQKCVGRFKLIDVLSVIASTTLFLPFIFMFFFLQCRIPSVKSNIWSELAAKGVSRSSAEFCKDRWWDAVHLPLQVFQKLAICFKCIFEASVYWKVHVHRCSIKLL